MKKVDIITSDGKKNNVGMQGKPKENAQPVVVVDGKVYPCDLTMGALVRYKREEGEEISEIKEGEICKLTTLMWCCARSSCSRDKVSFDMSLDDFADNITPQDVADWSALALFSRASDETDKEEEEKKA